MTSATAAHLVETRGTEASVGTNVTSTALSLVGGSRFGASALGAGTWAKARPHHR